ncbi:MAG TPA: hypothetical protein VGM56_09420 [Byssovorax sp.]|jgi:hypothetical protein
MNRTYSLRAAILTALGAFGSLGVASCSNDIPGCDDPQALYAGVGHQKVDSGFLLCADTSIDRSAPGSCAPGGDCVTDADCTASDACFCTGATTIPHPVLGTGVCVTATCHSDADCPSGECAVSQPCMGQIGCLVCRDLSSDTCRVGADCGNDFAAACEWSPSTSHFACVDVPTTGRLLRDAGRVVWTGYVDRADWAAGSARPRDAASPELGRALAEHWAAVAGTEHASVASFAQFSLQLLALGAPPELLVATQRAALDEIGHARAAYAIASAFAGRDLGPGPVDACGTALSGSRAALIEMLIADACVSELVSVTEMLFVAAAATDAAIVAFAVRAAREEEAHAALAWRALRWALEGASGDERRCARGLLEGRIESLAHPPAPAFEAPEHGVLTWADLRESRRQALRDVAVPAVEALFTGLEGALDPALVRQPRFVNAP